MSTSKKCSVNCNNSINGNNNNNSKYMRDYKISKKAGDKMWTCEITNSYGETHTNYFKTTRQCDEHIYYTWENEVNPAFLEHASDALLANAIKQCKEIDENANRRAIL